MWLSETRSSDDGVHFFYRHNALLWPSLTDFQVLLLLYRTCFWAGDTFAPKLRVRDGVLTQSFLQDAFLDMWEAVVRAVGDLDGVLGFEVCWSRLFLVYVVLLTVRGYFRADDEQTA